MYSLITIDNLIFTIYRKRGLNKFHEKALNLKALFQERFSISKILHSMTILIEKFFEETHWENQRK